MNVLPITRKRYSGIIRRRANVAFLLARSRYQGLTSFSPDRKQTNSCVIGNGIPKSGTYLINSILNYLGKWQNIGIHINPDHWEDQRSMPHRVTHPCLPQFSVQKLKNGQMVAGHLAWSEDLERSIAHVTDTRRIKHVMIFRDPRDIMISYMNFFVHTDRYSAATDTPLRQILLKECSNDDERLSYVIDTCFINQMKFFLPGKGHRYLNFEPWLHSPNCYAVKFEQLYPELRNLKDTGFGVALKGLLDYLEIDDTTVDPVDFYDHVYGKSPTASSEEDKVGQYQRVFKSQHYELLDNAEFKGLLHTMGYEW